MQSKTMVSAVVAIVILSIMGCDPSNNNNNVNPYISDSLSGYLISHKVIFDSSVSPEPPEEATAFFLSSPGGTTPVVVGSVEVNDLEMELYDDSLAYSVDNLFVPLFMDSSTHWQVVGAGSIPSFNYTYAVPYPAYTVSFPDTIVRATGFTLNFTATNADSIVVAAGSDTLGQLIKKQLAGSATSVSFSSTELAGLNPSHSMIALYLYKNSIQTFSSKKFLFSKVVTVTHQTFVD